MDRLISFFEWKRYHDMPIVGIVRGYSTEIIQQMLPVYQQAGLGTIEITMNSPGAAETIAWAHEHYGTQLNIGAGTVCNWKDLEIALTAGASFIVTPVLDQDVIQYCVERDIPIFPGAFSPTEIYTAWNLGAPMIKVFPSAQFGPGYLKAVHGPLPHIKLVPTGGIDLSNISTYLDAGAAGLGMGGGLFPKQAIAEGDWEVVGEHFRKIAQAYRSWRASRMV